MGSLEGKVVLITGAGTGIGKGIAQAFAAEGARLVLASRKPENLERAASELRLKGGIVAVAPADVTDEAQVLALFQKTLAEFGRLDILVNNAGVFDGGPLEELTLETWRRVIDVNLTGPFLCTREAMKIMKKQGGGRIINIGSISAQMPRMNSAPYTASKFGLAGLTKAAALEGRAHGIAACCIYPGNVLTERRGASGAPQDREPMMAPADLARAVLAMAALPPHVNLYEAIILPVAQDYLGRG